MANQTHRDQGATDKLSVVSRFYELLGAGDATAVLDLLDPQVQWTEAERFPYYAGTSIGPDAVLNNLLKRLAAEWDSFTATPNDFVIEGSRIVAFGTYDGVYKQTGKSIRADFAHVWTVSDGKITSHHAFTDTAKILEILTRDHELNHPEFHAPSGFCEPADWLASN
jgi:ketosteroid isomerase-like protein